MITNCFYHILESQREEVKLLLREKRYKTIDIGASLTEDKNKIKQILSEPMFVNNIIPKEFELEYLLSFLEKNLEL